MSRRKWTVGAALGLVLMVWIGLATTGSAAPEPQPGDVVGMWDPLTGAWHLRGAGGSDSFYYGARGDLPLVGDWDCDGLDTAGVYRPATGVVYVRNSNSTGMAEHTFSTGFPNDLPLAGDWNGDGCDTVAIYRPSQGKVVGRNSLTSGAPDFSFYFGIPGDGPFAGDFDGDGTTTVGLYRATTGQAYLRNTLTTGPADLSFYYGVPSDEIVVGDWDGDGDETVGVFRPSDARFYLSNENRQGFADIEFDFGKSSWLPVAGPLEGVSHEPVLTPVGDRSLAQPATLAFQVSASDADQQRLTFSLEGAVPPGATMTLDGQFTWPSGPGADVGEYVFDVVVTDETGGTDRETITVWRYSGVSCGTGISDGVISAPSGVPNVILIITDDQQAPATPNMPILEEEMTCAGTTFVNTFVSTPRCCPSRVSILRGQYAHNHGVVRNDPPDGGFNQVVANDLEASTIATWLQDAGYWTGLVAGKYVNKYGAADAPEPQTHVPVGWDDWFAKVSGLYFNETYNDNGSLVQFGAGAEDYQTDVLEGEAVDFIEAAAAQQEPFFLYLAPTSPHGIGENLAAPGEPAQAPLPAPRHAGTFAGAEAPRPPSFNEADISDKVLLSNLALLTDEQIAEIDFVYQKRMESLQSIDEMVGDLVAVLEATGELENTYIVFMSDNGYHLGHHRQMPHKGSVFEEDIQVPLIVRGPGIPAGQSRQELVLNSDLAPTLAQWGGAAVPDFVDGRSIVPLFDDRGTTPWREAIALEQWTVTEDQTGTRPSWRGVRTEQYKYVEYFPTAETMVAELYDLSVDPYELENFYPTADADLTERLAGWTANLSECAGMSCNFRSAAPAAWNVQAPGGGDCTRLGGNWDEASASCRLDTDLTLHSSDSLRVKLGAELVVGARLAVRGVVTNYGTITLAEGGVIAVADGGSLLNNGVVDAGPGGSVTTECLGSYTGAPPVGGPVDSICGRIVVEHQTIPASPSVRFSFVGDLVGQISGGQSISLDVNRGVYRTELVPATGWMLSDISCGDANSSGILGDAAALFRVEDAEIVTCIFTSVEEPVRAIDAEIVSIEGTRHVAVLLIGEVSGRVGVDVREVVSGELVSSVDFGAGASGTDLEILVDRGSAGPIPDLVVLRTDESGEVLVEARDAVSGVSTNTASFGSAYSGVDLEVRNGSLVVLGVRPLDQMVRAQTRAVSGRLVGSAFFGSQFSAGDLEVTDDTVVVLGTDPSGLVRTQGRHRTGALLGTAFYGSDFSAGDLEIVNGNPAVLGTRASDGLVRVQTRTTAGSLLGTAHYGAAYSGDELEMIGSDPAVLGVRDSDNLLRVQIRPFDGGPATTVHYGDAFSGTDLEFIGGDLAVLEVDGDNRVRVQIRTTAGTLVSTIVFN